MRLLNEEITNELTLKTENESDLFTIYEILEEGDIIKTTIFWKTKIGNENNYKIVKKRIKVEVKVKEVEIDNSLLIKGNLINETEYIKKNSIINIRIGINDIIEIKKKEISKYQKEIIKEAIKKTQDNLLILLDDDEIIACEFNKKSNIIINEGGFASGKLYHTKSKDREKIIEDIIKNKEYENIILSGPGFWKNQIHEKLKKITKNSNLIAFHWNEVSERAINKIVKKLNEKGILKTLKAAKEEALIEELLKEISKNGKYIYGKEGTINKIYEGGVEKLILTTKFLKENPDIREYMRLADKTKAKINILDSTTEPGKILDGLSGIGAILRYKS